MDSARLHLHTPQQSMYMYHNSMVLSILAFSSTNIFLNKFYLSSDSQPRFNGVMVLTVICENLKFALTNLKCFECL